MHLLFVFYVIYIIRKYFVVVFKSYQMYYCLISNNIGTIMFWLIPTVACFHMHKLHCFAGLFLWLLLPFYKFTSLQQRGFSRLCTHIEIECNLMIIYSFRYVPAFDCLNVLLLI